MKGKMYRPFSKVLEEPVERMNHSRPWVNEPEEARVYMWASSIPDKWLKIKGKTAFQHVSETGNNRDTLDFLKSNQKYISAIADPRTKTPSNASVNTSKHPSRLTTPDKSLRKTQDLQSTKENPGFLLQDQQTPSLEQRKSQDFKNVLNFAIPEIGKKMMTTGSLKSFDFEMPGKDSGYLINKYSLPKLLVSTQKIVKPVVSFKNKKVNQFLNRFEMKKEPISIEKDRKGLNGWKLVAIKRKS